MKPRAENHKPWYSKGLRFECQRCGRCCTRRGSYSFVFLTEADVGALAAELGARGHELVVQRFSEGDSVDGLLAVYREAVHEERA